MSKSRLPEGRSTPYAYSGTRSGFLDHNTCDSLTTVFPGEGFCARLGDTIYSGPNYYWKKAAELKYQVTVSSDSYLFIYRYAVVLQTGGHTSNMQPDFKVMITNDAGTVLDSTCGYYYITAQNSGPPVPGWHLCTNVANGDVYWKDWTTVIFFFFFYNKKSAPFFFFFGWSS